MDTNQNFPNISSPLVDRETLCIVDPWRRIILSLWNRTGQGPGVDALEGIEQALLGGLGPERDLSYALEAAQVQPVPPPVLFDGLPAIVTELQASVSDLAALALSNNVPSGGLVGTFTPGSVIFAGALGNLSQDNANFFWDDTNNRLGVGTNNIGARLHVAGFVRIDNDSVVTDSVLYMSPTFGGNVSQIQFRSTGGANVQDAGIVSGQGNVSNIAFFTGGASQAERMRIENGGNVAINNTSASARLDVGNATGWVSPSTINLLSRYSSSSAGTVIGTHSFLNQSVAATGTKRAFHGYVLANHLSGNVAGINGYDSLVTVGDAGNVTVGKGFHSTGILASSGNIDSLFSFHAGCITALSSGRAALAYGLKVENSSAAVTTQVGIGVEHTEHNYLAGTLAIGCVSTTPPIADVLLAVGNATGATLTTTLGILSRVATAAVGTQIGIQSYIEQTAAATGTKRAFLSQSISSHSTGNLTGLNGADFQIFSRGNGTVISARGVQINPTCESGGNITTFEAVAARAAVASGSGNIGTYYGLRVSDSGSAATTQIGVAVEHSGHNFANGTFALGCVSTAPQTSVALGLFSTTGAFLWPVLTTTQRNALTPANGFSIYNSTTGKFQGYQAGVWTDFDTAGGNVTYPIDLGNTSQVTNVLAVGNGGTGTSTVFTLGSVVFAGAGGNYTQDNGNFFWDDTNNRLGLGNNNPSVLLDVGNATGATLTTTLGILSRVATAAVSGTQIGIQSYIEQTAAATGTKRAFLSQSVANHTSGVVAGLNGADFQIFCSGNGSVTLAEGVNVTPSCLSNGNITTFEAFRARGATAAGNGTVGTYYGLRVSDSSSAAGAQIGVAVEHSGHNFLTGTLVVGCLSAVPISSAFLEVGNSTGAPVTTTLGILSRVDSSAAGTQIGVQSYVQHTAAATGTKRAFLGEVVATHSSGNVAGINGIDLQIFHSGNGTIDSSRGVLSVPALQSGGNITVFEAFSARPATKSGNGTVGTYYGLRAFDSSSAAGTQVGLAVEHAGHNFVNGTFSLGCVSLTPQTSVALGLYSTTGAFLWPVLSTTQRNALTAADGMSVYNSTLGVFEGRKAGAWTAFGTGNASYPINLTSDVTGVLPVGNGGTGTSTAFTAGSVVFAGASGVYAQDNTNFFWNDSSNYLGIGTPTPSVPLDINPGNSSATILTTTLGIASRVSTSSGSGTQIGVFSRIEQTASATGTKRAWLSQSVSSHGSGAVAGVNGGDFQVFCNGAGDITLARGSIFNPSCSSTGNITTAEAYKAQRATATSSGNIGAYYGFRQDDSSGNATVQIGFAIEHTGHNYVGGTLTLGCITATTPTSVALGIYSTTGALLLPALTTVQKNALTPSNGMEVYDTTLNLFQFYENGSWQGRGNASYPVALGNTSQVSGTLGVTNGGTGTATAFTQGSVVFAGGSGIYSQDNQNIFWDDTNNYLGLGTQAPVAPLDVHPGNATFATPLTTLGILSQATTSDSSGTKIGIQSVIEQSASATGTKRAWLSKTSTTHSSGNVAGANGGDFQVFCAGNGSITASAGINVTPTCDLAGNITTFEAFAARAAVANGTGKVGTYYGLRVRDSGAAAGAQIGVGVEHTGHNFLGGTLAVGCVSTTPVANVSLGVFSTTGAFLSPSMTTTQRDAMTPQDGMIIFNTSFSTFQGYRSGAWGNFTVI